MNYLSLRSAPNIAQAQPLTRRALSKQRSREKVLASARRLFGEKGYDGATIRDIARAAGLSTGAVFNNFDDKFSLFAEIVEADREALYTVIGAAAVGETVEETLLGMFDAGYRLVLQDLPLLQAVTGVSWSPEQGPPLRERLARWPITDLVGDVLNAAVDRGELAPTPHVPLVSQMLWDCFLANLSHVAFGKWRLEELLTRLTDQSRILLAALQRPSIDG